MDPAPRLVTPLPAAAAAPPPPSDRAAAEAAAEGALQRLVDDFRTGLGLAAPGVVWDDDLAAKLAPALHSYENERTCGVATGEKLFADVIRRHVPVGHTFKGLPQHVTTADPATIFGLFRQNDLANEILTCRTYKGGLAVRVRIFPLADAVVSVWAMLAIAYRPERGVA